MPQGPNIHFQVHLTKNGKAYGEIEVSVDGITLMRAPDYPLTALAEQLIEWSRRVDDGPGCDSFIFRHPPELVGTFRIEPRPAAWQFTSMWERRRHKRLLPLDDFKQMAARFHEQLSLRAESCK